MKKLRGGGRSGFCFVDLTEKVFHGENGLSVGAIKTNFWLSGGNSSF
jgi:hypothetical protein